MAEGMNLYETVIVTSAKLGEEGSAELVNRLKASSKTTVLLKVLTIGEAPLRLSHPRAERRGYCI